MPSDTTDGLILVSGLGRCGTSLLIQMLHAGGIPIAYPAISKWPSYEHPANVGRGKLEPGASGLLKWLDPQRFPPPAPVRVSIFIRRDPREQASSHVKFMRMLGGVAAPRRALMDSLKEDAPKAVTALAAVGPMVTMSFERLVLQARESLEVIRKTAGLEFDVEKAMRELYPRGVRCLPYMLEMAQMEDPRWGRTT